MSLQRAIVHVTICCLAAVVAIQPSVAEETDPSICVVESGPLRVEVTLEGVIVADEMEEVVVRPESWSDFSVVEAVDHGAHVKKGDVLIRFDSRKIDEALADMEAGAALADLSILQAEKALPQLEKSLLLSYEEAQRDYNEALEDYKRFVDVDRPLETKRADMSLKSAENGLSYEEEELKQLEKMYEADDLTEETEEIILKRQHDVVERMQFNVERSKVGRDHTIQTTLPRRDQSLRQSQEKSRLALAKAENAMSLSLNQRRLELEKQKHDRERDKEKQEQLEHDRSLMTIRAPADGVVYYGQCVDGEWQAKDSMASRLRLGGKISPDAVVMTVVQLAPVHALCSVPQEDLKDVRPNMPAKIQLTGDDKAAQGKVESVSQIPVAKDSFSATLSFQDDGPSQTPIPGMTCEATIIAYEKSDVLSVPASAVAPDPNDPDQYVVTVIKEGKEKTRKVRIGKRAKKRVEIVDGLKAGDKVLVDNSKSDGKAKGESKE